MSSEGSSVAAARLGEDYPNGANDILMSPVIDLTSYDPKDESLLNPGFNKRAFLTFDSWYSSEDYFDCGTVQVMRAPGTPDAYWEQIEPIENYPTAGGHCGGSNWTQAFTGLNLNSWSTYTLELTRFAGSKIQVGFVFSSDESVTYPGWFIDDVRLSFK